MRKILNVIGKKTGQKPTQSENMCDVKYLCKTKFFKKKKNNNNIEKDWKTTNTVRNIIR